VLGDAKSDDTAAIVPLTPSLNSAGVVYPISTFVPLSNIWLSPTVVPLGVNLAT